MFIVFLTSARVRGNICGWSWNWSWLNHILKVLTEVITVVVGGGGGGGGDGGGGGGGGGVWRLRWVEESGVGCESL